MDFTSTRQPGNAMLHYYAFCFGWELQAAALSWNRQLRILPCRDSSPACSGTEQQRALYTHFSQQHNTWMRKGPALPHCTDLCLSCQSHHQLRQGMLFGAECPARRQPWTAVMPDRSFTTSHFCGSLVERNKEAEKEPYVFVVVHLQKGPQSQINTGWVIAQQVILPAR